MNVRGKKVFVGLSGGVDSAVSAALLKEQGAQVIGVFIKGWYPPDMPCTWASERRDAMRVAARLHIPFLTFDASAEYKKSVIDYLISEYRAGRTPNPDVMCNREVKFGAFYRFAMSNGADAIAMGHYRSGEKDQSYFLWAVPKDILEATIFPVGSMEKKEVRALAKKFNLPVAEKRDSQGICFLGVVSVKEFLEKEFGNDNPAFLYTIGQRVEGGYVIGKDVEKKEIKVSKTRAGGAHEIRFTNANWHVAVVQHLVLHITAQYRYRGPRSTGRVEGDRFISSELLPELPAPGQSIVFYQGDELVGGGIITG
ncbi:MAG: asparagine synthase-related protein [bacterium]|nr:asparagine synthase-related protein [bacterium]